MHYKPEVDGLRALAVLPVIAYHSGASFIPGGFVGVDVFFVISGYLITSIIYKEYNAGRFKFVDFYRRRALRILPPFYTVLLTTLLAGYLILLPQEYAELSDSAISATFFSSNIFFWFSSGYFDGPAELKPLLHTWSLAVEEQFYFVFPFIFIAWLKYTKNNPVYLIASLTIFSFILSLYSSTRYPDASFYLLPFRAWELGIGALIATTNFENQKILKNDKIRNLVSVSGLILILGSYLIIKSSMTFPGINALYPCLGAAFIIIAGRNSVSGTILSWRPIVYIGVISYCLYLWHWPITSFLNISFNLSATETFSIVFATSFILSVLSKNLIEQPARTRFVNTKSSSIVVITACSILAFGGTSYALAQVQKEHSFFPANVSELAEFNDYRSRPDYQTQFTPGTCFYGINHQVPTSEDLNRCLTREEGKRNYILLGDSHAAHLWIGLQQSFGTDYNIMRVSASGCRPLLHAQGEKRCTDVINYVLNEYLLSNEIDGIILSARWSAQEPLEKVTETINYLKGFTDNVYVLGPTVEYFGSFPSLIARQTYFGKSVQTYIDQSRAALDDAMQHSVPDSSYISTYGYACPENSCLELSSIGEPMQFDYGHFTLSGSIDIANQITDKLKTMIDAPD